MDRSREDALREARLSQRRLRDRERARQRRATETAEEREARLARGRVRSRAVQNPRKHIRPGSNSFKAIRHAKLLPSPARRERPAYSCYAETRSRELLPSPARRERLVCSSYDITSNKGLPQRLRKRLKQRDRESHVQQTSAVTSNQPELHQPMVQSKMSKFHSEMASLQMSMCITCCERFPGLTVRMTPSGTECLRCVRDKQAYSSLNNMDPGTVPHELFVGASTHLADMLYYPICKLASARHAFAYYISVSRTSCKCACAVSYALLFIRNWTLPRDML